jgi:hypothetical protein
MDRYTHVVQEQEVEALSRLPDLCAQAAVVESGEAGTGAA